MTKKLLLAATLVLMLCGAIKAQEQDTVAQKPKIRTVFLTFLGTGYPEFLNLRLGWQINDEWSVAAKGSIYRTPGGYWGTASLVSLQVARYFPDSKIIINNISLGGSYYPEKDMENIVFEIYTGWEGVYRYVRPYWAVGFTYMNETYLNTHWNLEGTKLLDTKYHYFYPGIKVGLNFNL